MHRIDACRTWLVAAVLSGVLGCSAARQSPDETTPGSTVLATTERVDPQTTPVQDDVAATPAAPEGEGQIVAPGAGDTGPTVDDDVTEVDVAEVTADRALEPGFVKVELFGSTRWCGGAAPPRDWSGSYPMKPKAVAAAKPDGSVDQKTVTSIEADGIAPLPEGSAFWIQAQNGDWAPAAVRGEVLSGQLANSPPCAWQSNCGKKRVSANGKSKVVPCSSGPPSARPRVDPPP